MIKWTTIIAAVLGIPAALWAVAASALPPPILAPDGSPPVNPFSRGIAASGTVEAESRNVRVAPPEQGRIAQVFVQVNDSVRAGDPLFQLDLRLTEAELVKADAGVEIARQELERLRAMPRKEDLARLQAAVNLATARLDHSRKERERARRIHVRAALSDEEFGKTALALDEAIAGQMQAQSDLDRVRAGAWMHDLLVSEAALRRAQAEAEMVRARLDRLTVRSPIAGMVLKRYVEPGELASAGEQPAIVVGELSTLHIRARVDERDAPRLRADCRAVAFVPDQGSRSHNLRMLRIEPLAVPKTEASGSSSEAVDTRVIEVLFRVETDGRSRHFYPGQVVDVFIDAEKSP
jgi:multidrug efflux pump subunit AcrA (membrane-fusion protein)